MSHQKQALPLYHVSPLETLKFWELIGVPIDEEEARGKFEIANLKQEANIRMTWEVRDIGEGVSSHAHPGKGMVEVTLGDYNYGASFQLYDVSSVATIMKHELGHSSGWKHVENANDIMYP